MKLNETNQFIKDNFKNIIDGKFHDKFSTEQLETMLQCSFLYNHITLEADSIQFKYNDVILKVSNIYEIIHSSPFGVDYVEDEILNTIRNDEVFKSAYKSFLRDMRIETILK